jgi:hypothetical protein
MRALAATLLCLVQIGGSLLPQPAAADNTGQAAATRTGNCLTDPTRPACEAAARRATVEPSPAERFSLQKSVATGAAAGGVGGAIVGLATCAPVAWLPYAYAMCAISSTVFGVLGGGLAGGVADGIANFDSRSAVRPESAPRLNPVEQATIYERVASNGPTFEELRGRTEQAPQNNAIAVAIDARQWAWGAASAAATEDQAKGLALHRCREQAGLKGIANPCAIYSVNGQAIFFDPK